MNLTNTQNAIFEQLGQFLEGDGWFPQKLEGKTIYRMNFVGKNGKVICYAQFREEIQQIFFYVMSPVNVPEELRLSVAEFLTRANYGLRIGNFEMDFRDGEVRYKSSFDFESLDLTHKTFKNAIYPAVQTMDKYLPGLLQLIYSENDKSPATLIAEIEEESSRGRS